MYCSLCMHFFLHHIIIIRKVDATGRQVLLFMNISISVPDEPDLRKSHCLTQSKVVEREILVSGTPVRFRVDIMHEYLNLSDIVPLARMICDKLLDATVLASTNNKCPVSCRKGCAACCSYLVSLSIAEVFRLQNEFALMPANEGRIPILKSCVHAAFKILKQNVTGPKINGSSELKQISNWYAQLNLQCPFLSDGMCSIYEQRPLACREYFVTNSPNCCSGGSNEPDVVRLPVSMHEVLGVFAAQLEQSEIEAVMLPLALIGTDELTERSTHTWPSTMMIELLFDILEQTAAKNAETFNVSL